MISLGLFVYPNKFRLFKCLLSVMEGCSIVERLSGNIPGFIGELSLNVFSCIFNVFSLNKFVKILVLVLKILVLFLVFRLSMGLLICLFSLISETVFLVIIAFSC